MRCEKNVEKDSYSNWNRSISSCSATFYHKASHEKWREKYGQDASPASEVAMGFDAYMLALDAIERAGSEDDGNLVREALQNTAQYPGASGSITFDASGAPIKSVAIKSVAGGEIKSKYTVEPKWTVYEAESEETM